MSQIHVHSEYGNFEVDNAIICPRCYGHLTVYPPTLLEAHKAWHTLMDEELEALPREKTKQEQHWRPTGNKPGRPRKDASSDKQGYNAQEEKHESINRSRNPFPERR